MAVPLKRRIGLRIKRWQHNLLSVSPAGRAGFRRPPAFFGDYMQILNNLWNIILSVLNFMFSHDVNNPVYIVSVVFVVGIITLGTLKLLISRL